MELTSVSSRFGEPWGRNPFRASVNGAFIDIRYKCNKPLLRMESKYGATFSAAKTGKHNRVSPGCKDGQDAVGMKGAMKTRDTELAKEAQAIVALAFRNGPIEDVHAGKVCPVCHGSPDYSCITEDEMKAMMKSAVNAVYKLLWNRDHDSKASWTGIIRKYNLRPNGASPLGCPMLCNPE